MRLNLVADGGNETAILNYLEQNASEALVAKINSGNKTLAGCIAFIKGEVRNRAVNGCAMIEDKEVYGLATHYFEEESFKEGAKVSKPATPHVSEPKAAVVKKAEAKKEVKPKEEQLEGQINLFDLLG